jgi:hypothetical protein
MDTYEEDRLAALGERRKEEASAGPERPSLEETFGPGSFGCHEAMHVTDLVVDLIERQLVQHSAVILNPFWYAQVREAQALLYRAYSAAAAEHMGASSPEGGLSDVSSGMKG